MGEIPDDVREAAECVLDAYLCYCEHKSTPAEKAGELFSLVAGAILAERNRNGWQDIASAPTDWSDVLLHDPEYQNDFHKVFQGYFDAEQGDWLDCHGVIVSPTKWMPLPPSPDHKNTELRNEA